MWKDVEGDRTNYFYSDEGLIGEYDASGFEIKTYGYSPGSNFTTNPLFQKIGGTYYWYRNDHLGTPQMLIKTNGEVVWSAVYDTFGNCSTIVENVTNNLRFAGQYYDAETGLHYNLNRYYNPSIGRYLRHDPIGLEGGINLFLYVQNNPVNFIDPEGEWLAAAYEWLTLNGPWWIENGPNTYDLLRKTSDYVDECMLTSREDYYKPAVDRGFEAIWDFLMQTGTPYSQKN